MDYSAAVDYIYRSLPMFHRIGAAAYNKDLGNTLKLCHHLGHPHTQGKYIHIAGTNGKGSTSHMLASIFSEAGFKTGLYTSPHLKDFRERIRINGVMVPETYIADFITRHQAFLEGFTPSFFEITMAMAFDHFSHEHTDLNILETGMGGRLDSTNVVMPELSVITNIGMDHMQFLGDSLPAIAAEKAGIIKPGIPVVIGENHPETREVFTRMALEKSAPLYWAEKLVQVEVQEITPEMVWYRVDSEYYGSFEVATPLTGSYQAKNIRTVLAVLSVYSMHCVPVGLEAVCRGIQQVKENTGLQGRWEILSRKPLVIMDVGHNVHGFAETMPQLMRYPAIRRHFVLGFVNDKDVANVLTYFPQDAFYYISKPDIPRGMEIPQLEAILNSLGYACQSFPTIAEAYQAAREAAGEDDLVFAGGSTFVVAELL